LSQDITLDFNTRWKYQDLGDRPFIPNVHAQYLGTAIEGDIIELEINHSQTKYLSPSFGSLSQVWALRRADSYTNFSYNMLMSTATFPFDYEQALDFEISFAINGRQGDWLNLVPARSPYRESYWNGLSEPGVIEYSWNYLDQKFVVRFSVPYDLPGIGGDRLVDMYLRTAPNSAYRESIWPLRHDQVKKFRGRIVSATVNEATNRTTIKTEYNSGEISMGDDLRINTGSGLYDVITAVENTGTHQYEIVVTGAVTAQQGDWAVVDLSEALAEPEMQLLIDNAFFTQWNSEVSPSNLTRQPLLTGNTNTDFTPVRSLGYQPNYIVGNWLGNNNYGNPLWNNWSDASSWSSFSSSWTNWIDRVFYPLLSTSSGYYFNLIPYRFQTGNDYSVSTTNTNAQTNPEVSISGNRALAVWVSNNGSDTDIRGRLIDVDTGLGIINDFLISNTSTSNQSNPQVSISGNYALVVWQSYNGSNYDIYGRVINITAATLSEVFVGNNFLVSNTVANTQENPRLGISGDRALVVWESHYGSTWDIRGRFISLSSGDNQIATTEFDVCATIANDQNNPDISVSNGRALVVWESNNGSNDDIRGRIFTMSSGTGSGEFLVNDTTTANEQWYPYVEVSGDYALVAWWSNNGANWDIIGRVVTMTTGDTQEGSEIPISTNNSADQQQPRIGISGGRALVVWRSGVSGSWDIRGRIINLADSTADGNDFRVTTNLWNSNDLPDISVSGDQALVVWSAINGGNADIRGRIINMRTGTGPYRDFLLSTTSVNNQTNPKAALSGAQALAVWQSNNGSNDDINGIKLTTLITGNSFPNRLRNFFVSPMIERDYTVRVKMIDPLSE